MFLQQTYRQKNVGQKNNEVAIASNFVFNTAFFVPSCLGGKKIVCREFCSAMT
jgi:hypothetical protein